MSADRFVTLSDSIDRHEIEAQRIIAPALFLASKSDRLVPAEDVKRLAELVACGTFVSFESLYGHDAFLKEAATIGPIIKSFIEGTQI
jgi:homoserine O-acetyltransferase